MEIGSEATPADFLDTLLDVVEACDRVLAPHGTLIFELGDTYAGSGGHGGDYELGGMREGQPKFEGSARQARFDGRDSKAYGTGSAPRPPRVGRQQALVDGSARRGDARVQYEGMGSIPGRKHYTVPKSNRRDGLPVGQPRLNLSRAQRDALVGWPMDKSLCGIPTLFAWSLAYGFNVLRGPEQIVGVDDYGEALTVGRSTPRWRVRNLVAWCRPNPPVGALGDKIRPATSYLIVACKSRTRYFDLDAVRKTDGPGGNPTRRSSLNRSHPGEHTQDERDLEVLDNPAGAPPLDHWWFDDDSFDQDAWLVTTEAYEGAHYATWPTKLLDIPIQSCCPQRVCTTCGQPSRRLTEVTYEADPNGAPKYQTSEFSVVRLREPKGGSRGSDMDKLGQREQNAQHMANGRATRLATTVGWTDCGCPGGEARWRRGVVLDPFGGSGTTGAVATGHGRDAVLIDLDERNAQLAVDRIGPLMCSVEYLKQPDELELAATEGG